MAAPRFTKGAISPPPANGEFDPARPEEFFQRYLQGRTANKAGDMSRHTRMVAITDALYKQAKGGNTRAATLLFNRAFGMPKQKIEHAGELGLNDSRRSILDRFMARSTGTMRTVTPTALPDTTTGNPTPTEAAEAVKAITSPPPVTSPLAAVLSTASRAKG